MYRVAQINGTNVLGTCRILVNYYECFQLIGRQDTLMNETFPSNKLLLNATCNLPNFL